MLDLRYVVDNLDSVRETLARRSDADAALLDPIANLAQKRLDVIKTSEAKQAERNAASKAMATLDKSGSEFAERREQLKGLSGEVKQLERELAEIQDQIDEALSRVPNLPDASVPTGTSEDDNEVVHTWGDKPTFDFEPREHDTIGVELGILDFERAAKLSGPRFVVERGLGARLERSLINFMIDLHTREHGYLEIMPPFMIKDSALYGTGQLPKFADDLFKTSKADPDKTYDLFLSPTAEVPVTNLHGKEILDAGELPIAYVAYTPCFRSEAGSYGKDTRGMIRQHQFNKVELVRICDAESSMDQLELLTSHAEEVLKRLQLHFRRVTLCTADLGFSAVKTYDLEVWLPGQGKYREISSCSNCGDFQARRAKIRHRVEGKKKPQLCHTLNGSGLAVGRTVVAILEQYQQADGSVVVPEALRPYVGEEVIKGPR
jgi:seryl-tRNA synthetase